MHSKNVQNQEEINYGLGRRVIDSAKINLLSSCQIIGFRDELQKLYTFKILSELESGSRVVKTSARTQGRTLEEVVFGLGFKGVVGLGCLKK